MLWFLTSLAVYIVGWAFAIPGALQRRMSALACDACGASKRTSTTSDHGARHLGCPYGSRYRTRGAVYERTDTDVAAAMSMALLWLPLLPWRITSSFMRQRFLTSQEKERVIREMQKRIDRLTRELER